MPPWVNLLAPRDILTMSFSHVTKRFSPWVLLVGGGKAVNKMNATRRKPSDTKRYPHREFSSLHQKILTVRISLITTWCFALSWPVRDVSHYMLYGDLNTTISHIRKLDSTILKIYWDNVLKPGKGAWSYNGASFFKLKELVNALVESQILAH